MSNEGLRSDDSLTLKQAADALGVHYMTAYRYVRTGRLTAERSDGQWRVPASALTALENAGAPGRNGESPGSRQARPSRRRYEVQLSACLIKGDEPTAWRVTQEALSSAYSLEELYLDVLSAAMRHIGDEWAAGRLSIADEHRATALLLRLIGRLGTGFIRPGRSRGLVVLGAPQGDYHGLATALLADVLRGRRIAVIDLGAHTPAGSFAEIATSRTDLIGIGIVVSAPLSDTVLTRFVSEIRSNTASPILLGGVAIEDEGHAVRLGASAFSPSSRAALEWFDQLR